MRKVAALVASRACVAGCGGSDGQRVGAVAGGPLRRPTRLSRPARAGADRPPAGRLGGEPPGGAADRPAAARGRRAPRFGCSIPIATSSASIPGEVPGTVVVGAHHDTKDIPGFVGANDGASAVAVLLELARGLPGRLARALDRAGLLRRGGGARRQALRRSTGRAAAASSSATRDAAASRARRRWARSAPWSSSTWSATATSRSRVRRTRTPASTSCSRMPRRSSPAAPRRSWATRPRSSTTTSPSRTRGSGPSA